MTKVWDDFPKELKKFQSKHKTASLADAEKLKSEILKSLKAAWSKEDDLREAITKARASGIKGEKHSDFKSNSAYSSALDTWKKTVAVYRDKVTSLEKISGAAQKSVGEWTRKHSELQKEAKKTPKPIPKKIDDVLKESQKELDARKSASSVFGSLKAHEVFYALKEKQSIEAIVKDVLKKLKGQDLPEFLDEDKRKRNAKAMERLEKNVAKFCKLASDQSDNADKANKSLKAAAGHLKTLEAMNKEHQAAKSKQKKLIAAHDDKSKIEKQIKDVEAAYKRSLKTYEAAEDKVEESAAAG